jgi:hypothetical protein
VDDTERNFPEVTPVIPEHALRHGWLSSNPYECALFSGIYGYLLFSKNIIKNLFLTIDSICTLTQHDEKRIIRTGSNLTGRLPDGT